MPRVKTVNIAGKAVGAGPIHKFVDGYPRRIVVTDATDKGWMYCDHCDQQFRLWMTDDEVWRRLSRSNQALILCVPCFRKAVR